MHDCSPEIFELRKRVERSECAWYDYFEAIEKAARSWAASTDDGAMVWDVAGMLIPDMWKEYERAVGSPDLRDRDDLREEIESIACATMDETVIAAVNEARAALANYAE